MTASSEMNIIVAMESAYNRLDKENFALIAERDRYRKSLDKLADEKFDWCSDCQGMLAYDDWVQHTARQALSNESIESIHDPVDMYRKRENINISDEMIERGARAIYDLDPFRNEIAENVYEPIDWQYVDSDDRSYYIHISKIVLTAALGDKP